MCFFIFKKHKVTYKKGFGFRCKRCGKTVHDINQDGEKYKVVR